MDKKDYRGGKAESPTPGRSPARGRAQTRSSSQPREEEVKPGMSTVGTITQSAIEMMKSVKLAFSDEEFRIGTVTVPRPRDNDDSASYTTERGSGQRATRRGVSRYVMAPEPSLKPVNMGSKQGSSGTKLQLLSNYFQVKKHPNWSLYQHRVDFEPEEDNVSRRKGLLRSVSGKLGGYIFDGTLYSKENLGECACI